MATAKVIVNIAVCSFFMFFSCFNHFVGSDFRFDVQATTHSFTRLV
jgi:hypothetical protein